MTGAAGVACPLTGLSRRRLYLLLSEDEHQLIMQYCHSLNTSNGCAAGGGGGGAPVPCSPVQLVREIDGSQRHQLETMIRELEDENKSLQAEYQRLRSAGPAPTADLPAGPRDREMLTEARLLRQHKGRLETRMQVLEEHNRQLEQQLSKLRRLLDEVRLPVVSTGRQPGTQANHIPIFNSSINALPAIFYRAVLQCCAFAYILM